MPERGEGEVALMSSDTFDEPTFHYFMFGSSEIAFMLTRNQCRTVRIVVLPDRKVFVEAPADHPLEEILKRVHQRAVWKSDGAVAQRPV